MPIAFDERGFPLYNGESLSWNIGDYMTTAEASAGYPRARAVIAAMNDRCPDQLYHAWWDSLHGSVNRIVGPIADEVLGLIHDEISPDRIEEIELQLQAKAQKPGIRP
jgi:hypothetical protein